MQEEYTRRPDPQLREYVAGLRNWVKEIDVVDEKLRSAPSTKEEGSLRTVNKKEEAVKEKDLGNKFFQEKKFKEAIECYTRSFELDPESPIALANRGMAYLQLKQWQLAEKDCTDTIKMDPNYVKAYARRGTARMNLGNLEGAKQDFQKVLQLEKGNKQAQQEIEKINKMEEVINAKPKPTPKPKPSPSTSPAPKIQPLDTTSPLIKQPTTTTPSPAKPTATNPPIKEAPKLVQKQEQQPQQTQQPQQQSLVSSPTPTFESQVNATTPATAPSENTSVLLNLSLPTSAVVTIDGMNVTIPDKPPKTFFELERTWQSLKKDLPAFAKYFKLIEPSSYRLLFKNSLHPDILTSIVEAVGHCLLRDNPQLAFSILQGMTSVNRFGMIALSLPSSPKEVVKACCHELVQQGTITAEKEKRLLQEYL